ncbi:protein kinase [Kitasatospora sp. NPDC088346]|uniref:protein kinase domain-containing protein n=1 Tax=Kitasatospora sp. NPDC088346 TaxID=3364073 RepID=UPI00380F6FF7
MCSTADDGRHRTGTPGRAGATDVEGTTKVHAAGPIRSVGNGRYVLRSPLGEGGMASVYRADDLVLGRTVAVKTLHADLARDPSFRERFRREARAVAALGHTNIVAVHDSGEDTDDDGDVVPYIVMEYVRGGSVRQLLRARADGTGREALPLDRALALTAAVLDALDHSHRNGLIHRDIKPANVMVTEDGTVKVMDFGIARALQSDATAMTRTGTVLGTPQYLSPEQALGRPADARSDLYSVGCMLYELVTGSVPFDGESTMSVLYQHVQQPAPTPSTTRPELPPALDAVVARALHKDPQQRHRSAGEMAAELRRIATGEPPAGEGDRRCGPELPPHHAVTVTAETVAVAPPGAGESGPAGAGAADAGAADADAGVRVRVRRNAPRRGPLPLVAIPAVAVLLAAGAFGVPHLFGSAPRTPDPRATGAYAGCDPASVPGSEHNPPSFTGMSPAEARTCAGIAGLTLDQKEARGTRQDKDTVTRQEPEASRTVRPGGTVTVWVSTGGDPRATGDLEKCEVEERHGKVSVPWLQGLSAADARVCADIARLAVEDAGPLQDPLTPAGRIARQEPRSQDVSTGSTVKVWTSSGGDPRAVGPLGGCDLYATAEQPEAPFLQLKSTADARLCAEIARVRLEEHTVPDALWPAGQVVRQEPASGTRITPGGTIEVWISSGSP